MNVRRYRVILLWVFIATIALRVPLFAAENPRNWSRANVGTLVELYRTLHQHPELSGQEKETAARVANEFRAAGFAVTTGVGGHGVVGLLKNGAGPTLMLRTDLDALPVTEQTGLAYASKVRTTGTDGRSTGVMHACGHDIHITGLVGTARYMAKHKDRWRGTLMLIGQPAEETTTGARQMLKDGLFTRFAKPDFALAVHVAPALATGKIGYRAGAAMANVNTVDITMRGRGGHGAAPHTTIDPVVLAAHLVIDLQTLVSRENDPNEPAVITVGSIHGGAQHNVISDACQLQLTVRTYSDEVREALLEGIRRKARAVAEGARAPAPEVKVSDDWLPAVQNDEKLVERLLPALRGALGAGNVVEAKRLMAGEDFSRYGEAGVPILMLSLGSVNKNRLAGLTRGGMSPPSLHSPLYYPDAEETLVTAITVLSTAAMDLLPVPPARAGNKP